MPLDSEKCEFHFEVFPFLTDSSTSSSFWLGILLNSIGSFAKILSLIVVLNAEKTSSPDLNINVLSSALKAYIPPKKVCRVVSEF